MGRREFAFKGIVAAGAPVMASTVAAEPSKAQGKFLWFILFILTMGFCYRISKFYDFASYKSSNILL